MLGNIETTALEILRKYPIKRAALFGSAARGDMTETSDIDLVVEFLPKQAGAGFNFFGLHSDLEEAFDRHVDLVTYSSLYNEAKPAFREAVLRDLRVIYERTA
jgi:predicted nucleotidyltransferase